MRVQGTGWRFELDLVALMAVVATMVIGIECKRQIGEVLSAIAGRIRREPASVEETEPPRRLRVEAASADK